MPSNRQNFLKLYQSIKSPRDMRQLCLDDLFYLMTVVLGRVDMNSDFCFDRCMEVQFSPNGHLDLWAREHYKSTIITWGKTIQDILRNPEITVGIFSHTRPIAKTFLKQIMREFEANELLKALFPDVLYQNPKKESRQWSEEAGIIVNRKTNPKEATVEAWGLVDGQPTGRHFSLMVYDDVVTRESVSTPEMIAKTTAAWELSLNLSARGGAERYIGTRYHANDTYATMMEREAVKPRIYPATIDGTPDGEPVLLDKELLAKKRKTMGVFTFACQMLQNPLADNAQGFREEWLRYWAGKPSAGEIGDDGKELKDHTEGMNIYIVVDPASEKKKDNDYTVMAVIGLAQDNNYYLIDGVHDRLNLTEKCRTLFRLHKKHRPVAVGYEKYGMQSDIEYIQQEMQRLNYHFEITALGGKIAKLDRIRSLVPIFESNRFYIPHSIPFRDYDGKMQDFIEDFKTEYRTFPVCKHDDMLDCIARILDPIMCTEFPDIVDAEHSVEESFYLEEMQEGNLKDPLARWRQ